MFTNNVITDILDPNLKGSTDVDQIENAIDLMKIKQESAIEPMEVEQEETTLEKIEIKSEKTHLAEVTMNYVSFQKHVMPTQKRSGDKLNGRIYKALPIPARPIPARPIPAIPTRPRTENKILSLRPIGKVCDNIVKNVKDVIKSRFFCQVCGKIYMSKQRLESHMSTHTHERRHKCNSCDDAFARSDHLSNHVRNKHTHEKPFQCDQCSYECAQKSTLTVHKRSHSKEKPYKCDTCGKVFSYKNSLNVHVKHHSNERFSYPCRICATTFDYPSNLKRHMKSIHNNVKTV